MILYQKYSPKRSSGKDRWDKFEILSKFMTGMFGLLIALVGFYFTRVYNNQQSARAEEQSKRDEESRKQQMGISRTQAVGQLMPYLAGRDENQKKIALLLVRELTDREFFESIVAIIPGKGTVAALQEVATSGNENDRKEASKGLAIIASSGRENDKKLAASVLEKVIPDSFYTAKTGEDITVEVTPEGITDGVFSAKLDGREIKREGNFFRFTINGAPGQNSYLIMAFKFPGKQEGKYKIKISGNERLPTINQVVLSTSRNQTSTVIFKIV